LYINWIEKLMRISGRIIDAGEIDVLAVDVVNRQIHVLECKSLLFAKTPYEMRQQLDTVVNRDPNKKTAVSQVLKKAAWVSDNIEGVVQAFSLPHSDSGNWSVHPAVVVDHRIFVTLVESFEVQIIDHEAMPSLFKL
jgi:hypothetical protein